MNIVCFCLSFFGESITLFFVYKLKLYYTIDFYLLNSDKQYLLITYSKLISKVK
jgi:hypothetical protein